MQVGARPEDLHTGSTGVAAVVELVEPLGSETLVHWSSPVGAWVSRVTSGPVPRVGDRASLTGRPEGLLLFDATTQRALLAPEVATATH